MSLTQHLNDKSSPVREYVYSCVPRLAIAGGRGREGKIAANEFCFDDLLGRKLVAAIPESVESRRSHAPLVGTAFDYRTRMMLDELNPRKTVAAGGVDRLAQDVEHIENGEHRLRILTEGFDLAERFISSGGTEGLDRSSILLALCENVYRAFPIVFDGSLGSQLDAAENGANLFAGLGEPLVEDISALRLANFAQIASWREQINGGTVFAPNPTFRGSILVGGADADWIIGDGLIECKTVEKPAAPWLRETLFQMLAYALLDLEDEFFIRRVAVWLPRQAVLKEWTLDDLLGTGSENTLKKLRRGFLAII